MADGINPQRSRDEAWVVMRKAKDFPRDGEGDLVKAARMAIAECERDPSDGRFRMMTALDEARLVRAIARAPREGVGVEGLASTLKADVAVQRMGEARERDPFAPGARSPFRPRDVAAVGGASRAEALSGASSVDAGWLKAGRFDMASPRVRAAAAAIVADAGGWSRDTDPVLSAAPAPRLGGLAAQAAGLVGRGVAAMPRGRDVEEMPMPMGVGRGGYGR